MKVKFCLTLPNCVSDNKFPILFKGHLNNLLPLFKFCENLTKP